MVYLAILALAYRRLSDTPLPDVKQGVGASLLVSNARRLWSALAIVLMLFDGLIEDINGRIKAYGIEVTALQIAAGHGSG